MTTPKTKAAPKAKAKRTPALAEQIAELMKHGTFRLTGVKQGTVVQLVCVGRGGQHIEVQGDDTERVIAAAYEASAMQKV